MRDFLRGFSFLNVNIFPFMGLECIGYNLGLEPGSWFYPNMALKASIPLWLILFASLAFFYLRRKSAAADEKGLERIAGYKAAVIVFTLFMLNVLHPRCVYRSTSLEPSMPSAPR